VAARCAALVGVLVGTTALLTPSAAAAEDELAEAPLEPVVDDVLDGDLVMAGNSNLLVAGGWRQAAAADVDGDDTVLCIGRRFVPAACGENSSSATLDLPAGARVVAARLYVNTSLSTAASAVRVRLDGPAEGYEYVELGADTPGIPKVRENAGTVSRAASAMRQAVWDVTEFVQEHGPGTYTVADIMSERAGAYLPYASWTIVAAYELDPEADLGAMAPEDQVRFAARRVAWYDGFEVLVDGAAGISVDGFTVPAGEPVFAKTFHLAAHAQHRGADSLLFDGRPVGNNVLPGDAPPPLGVVLGDDPACNAVTDVLNDTICVLGAPVATKDPGPDEFAASADGKRPTSGSGVDFDVNRVPARSFVPGRTSATLSLRVQGTRPVAVGVLATSIDLPEVDPAVSPVRAIVTTPDLAVMP
jgi:hypothetical protein